MRTTGYFFLLALMLFPGLATAQNLQSNHRIVIEVTTQQPSAWEAVLNNVENLQKAFGAANTQIEVVAHGKGIGLLRNTNVSMGTRLKQISESGVVFAACSNTMRHLKLSPRDLFPFAKVVDSGVAEVVRKQEAGWTYLKAGD